MAFPSRRASAHSLQGIGACKDVPFCNKAVVCCDSYAESSKSGKRLRRRTEQSGAGSQAGRYRLQNRVPGKTVTQANRTRRHLRNGCKATDRTVTQNRVNPAKRLRKRAEQRRHLRNGSQATAGQLRRIG